MAKTKTVTPKVNLRKLYYRIRQLGREQPDRKAECRYTTGRSHANLAPMCIVGQAMIDLGVDPIVLKKANGAQFRALVGESGYNSPIVAVTGGGQDRKRMISEIANVQSLQDQRRTWAEATKGM